MTRPRALTRTLLAGGVASLAVVGFAPTFASAASNNDTVTVAGGSSYVYTFNQSPSIQAVAQPNCAVLSNPKPLTLSISGERVAVAAGPGGHAPIRVRCRGETAVLAPGGRVAFPGAGALPRGR